MAKTTLFTRAYRDILRGTINLTTDTLKFALVDDNYVFDRSTLVFDTGANDVNDPSHNEIAATNYARKTLTGTLSIQEDNDTGNGQVVFVLPDQAFGSLGGAQNDTVAGCILFKDTGDLTTSPVIAYFPCLAQVTTTGIPFTIDANSLAQGGQMRFLLPAQA